MQHLGVVSARATLAIVSLLVVAIPYAEPVACGFAGHTTVMELPCADSAVTAGPTHQSGCHSSSCAHQAAALAEAGIEVGGVRVPVVDRPLATEAPHPAQPEVRLPPPKR